MIFQNISSGFSRIKKKKVSVTEDEKRIGS